MKPNGINIELTPSQYDYLYDVLMEAYANDVAEQKEWDIQTFDNLIAVSYTHLTLPTKA